MNRVIILESEQARKDLAEQYLALVDMLGLENRYIKGNDISGLLGITRREWNKIVEDVLHLYVAGVLDKMLVGTQKGFVYTGDYEVLDKFVIARKNHFKSQAYNTCAVARKLYKRNNLTIDELVGL